MTHALYASTPVPVERADLTMLMRLHDDQHTGWQWCPCRVARMLRRFQRAGGVELRRKGRRGAEIAGEGVS